MGVGAGVGSAVGAGVSVGRGEARSVGVGCETTSPPGRPTWTLGLAIRTDSSPGPASASATEIPISAAAAAPTMGNTMGRRMRSSGHPANPTCAVLPVGRSTADGEAFVSGTTLGAAGAAAWSAVRRRAALPRSLRPFFPTHGSKQPPCRGTIQRRGSGSVLRLGARVTATCAAMIATRLVIRASPRTIVALARGGHATTVHAVQAEYRAVTSSGHAT